ncbi:unnamed protein product [Rangifer tarandus platyrhynchus]|uniref:Uncharacterized protein n=2 Tax=Rangifer tarandus platyrhynchus TaxID=3082113 RepID=A0ACB0FG77_RANTA|nr:unnamed protein product [Rangifer tarandus platyrhynchus]CAI9712085.1 unnamed protein product [Rangifer tarandus platyrhynchus]
MDAARSRRGPRSLGRRPAPGVTEGRAGALALRPSQRSESRRRAPRARLGGHALQFTRLQAAAPAPGLEAEAAGWGGDGPGRAVFGGGRRPRGRVVGPCQAAVSAPRDRLPRGALS